MIHHGDALRLLLKREGLGLSALARKLYVHPNTITNYVQSPEIKLDVWRQIAGVLTMEPADLVPGLPLFHSKEPNAVAEQVAAYALPAGSKPPETLSACQRELLRVQAAYIALLQEHLSLVRAKTPAAS